VHHLVSLQVPCFLYLPGSVGHVAQLLEMCDELSNSQKSETNLHHANSLNFIDVTCFTPQNSLLVSNLNLQVSLNNNLLIMGPSGCGKSSQYRRCVHFDFFYKRKYGPPKVSGSARDLFLDPR